MQNTMEKTQDFLPINKYYTFIFFWLLTTIVIAQPKPVNPILKLSIDRNENIYFSDARYSVFKQIDGNVTNVFSPKRISQITLLEAWNTAKIFVFYKDLQSFTILDRFLTEIETINFDYEKTGFVEIATPSLDGNIWIIDNSSYALKKINIQNQEILTETKLDLILPTLNNQILDAQEYHNFLYISTLENGVLIFDNMGNYKKKIFLNEIYELTFYSDELYFIENEKLKKFNLYNFDTKESLEKINNIEIFKLSSKGIHFINKEKGVELTPHHSF